MTKEFLAELGIEGEAAEAIIAEAAREAEEAGAENGELRSSLEAKDNELFELKRDFAVEGELRRMGAKNSRAVRALLDMEGIGTDEESLAELVRRLEEIKRENDYLFAGAKEPRIVGRTGGAEKKFGMKFTGVR